MRVIVTRPAGEAGRWLDELRARGFDAVALPLMAIAPVLDASVLRGAWRNGRNTSRYATAPTSADEHIDQPPVPGEYVFDLGRINHIKGGPDYSSVEGGVVGGEVEGGVGDGRGGGGEVEVAPGDCWIEIVAHPREEVFEACILAEHRRDIAQLMRPPAHAGAYRISTSLTPCRLASPSSPEQPASVLKLS